MTAHLKEERPDSVIILAGGNDLPTSKKKPTSVVDITNHIIGIGVICARYNVSKVIISSVLPREEAYMQLRRKEVNDLWRNWCEINNFTFIENKNIILCKHILRDGVHLNNVGSDLLANNLGMYY